MRAYIAETSDSNLWLFASRKATTGADEGVILHLEQGRTFTQRVNVNDALPAAWIPTLQQGVTVPIGIVAHGDGVLAQYQTNFGYLLVRVERTARSTRRSAIVSAAATARFPQRRSR